jgi:hypothetical protein
VAAHGAEAVNRPVGPQHLTLFIAAIVFTAGNKTVRFQ